MAANINRVVLVGNLTRDPELRHTPGGTPVCSLRIAVNSRRKRRVAATGSTSRTTSASPSSATRPRAARSTSSKGRPVAVDGRLDWREWEAKDGGGKRESVEIVAESVQFLGSRGDGDGAAAAAATSSCRQVPAPRAEPTSRQQPTTTSRSRRGMAPRERQQAQQRKRPGGPAGAIKRRNCFFCKEKVAEIDYKNVSQLRRYISEKGKIRSRRITGACRRHQVQVATGREAGARDGAPAVRRRGRRRPRARRRPRPPRPRGTLMEVILLKDVEKVGLRGDVVSVARGYARNFLLPAQARRGGDGGAGGRAAQARRPAGAARGEDRRRGAGDRGEARRRPSCAST